LNEAEGRTEQGGIALATQDVNFRSGKLPEVNKGEEKVTE